MTAMEPVGDIPALAVPRPHPGRTSFMQRLRGLRDNVLATYPEEALERGYVKWRRAPWWSELMVGDPAGIKHILLDNRANYTKSVLFRSLLEPALGNGLLTSEGDVWRRHRRIVAPSFDRRSILACAPIMTDASEQMAAGWDTLGPDSKVDVARAMMCLTLTIIFKTMFSSDAEAMADIVEHGFGRYQSEVMPTILDYVGLPDWIGHRARQKTARRTLGEYDAAARRLIVERSALAADGPNDLLARLIAARDEETGQGMTAQEVRDQVATIFVAGHETTALVLTWAWYLLSQHPTWEAQLHAELADVLGGNTPTHQDIDRLVLTRMVIEETMRLYPPVHSLLLQAIADDEVGGHRVPKGARIRISPWVVHRHTLLWDHPERFDPLRFSPERSAGRPRFAYIPFSGGPRVCVGAAFAMAEAVLVLATLAQRYRLRLAPGSPVEVQSLLTLKPRYGMQMILERRVTPTRI